MTRKGDFTCYCSAYNFPHRFSGGPCVGFNVVEDTWEKWFGGGPCADCHLNNNNEYCEVVSGQEQTKYCPEWQDFVHYNEIRIK